MSFESDFRARLAADATIAGIVSSRIYWEIRAQNSALPAIVLTEVFGERAQTFSGVMGTQSKRVQIDCMAMKGTDALALRDAVCAVIEASGTQGGTTFQGGFVNLTRATASDVTDSVVRNAMIDATLWFN